MRPKKLILDFEVPDDMRMIGISSHTKDYRLAFYLNKQLNIQFVRKKDLCNGSVENPAYPIYHFDDEENHLQWHLVGNVQRNKALIASLKHFDFVVLLEGCHAPDMCSSVVPRINSIPNVLMAVDINLHKVKKLENFLTDLELHMIDLETKDKRARGIMPRASLKKFNS